MDRIEELCCYYIASLRSIALIHQNNHWLVKGHNSYANHLLFERIYASAQEDSDLMAEKMVGVFNADCLDIALQAKIISKQLSKYTGEDFLLNSLEAETDFIAFSKHFYETLKEQEELTLGLDDAIMAVSSSREEAVYLLKQATANFEQSISSVVARTNLLKKIKKAITK